MEAAWSPGATLNQSASASRSDARGRSRRSSARDFRRSQASNRWEKWGANDGTSLGPRARPRWSRRRPRADRRGARRVGRRAPGAGRPRGRPRGLGHEGGASRRPSRGHVRVPRGAGPEGGRDRGGGREPRRGRRADRPGPEAARLRGRAPSPSRDRDVRDERQLRGQGGDREPDHAGRVPGEPQGDRRGPARPRHRADPDDRAALGRRCPTNGLGENPNVRLSPYMDACREVAAECRVPLVDHFARWSEARSKGRRSPTGRPTVATRTRGVIANWPRPCCRPSATRSGLHPGPSASRPVSTRCSLATTANSTGATRGRRPSRTRPATLPRTVMLGTGGDKQRGLAMRYQTWTVGGGTGGRSGPGRGPVAAGAGPGAIGSCAGLRSSRGTSCGPGRRPGDRAARGVGGARAGPGRGGRSWVTRDPAGYCATACRRAGRAVNPARPPLRRSPGPYMCGWPE